MAHEIHIRSNGFAEMAFVGQTPWHSLGQRVQEGATIETWAAQSGLDWHAESAAVQYPTPNGMRVFSDKKVIYRSDSHDALSVVGEGYQIVQPMEVLEFFRDLTESGGWHIHTAGSLMGGRRIWALARNHTEGEASPGDRVKGNLLLATSLDGTMRTTAAMTAVRVVCANTLRLALSGLKTARQGKGKADAIAVSHRSVFDADTVKEQLGVARESFDAFMIRARAMAETPIAQDEAKEILRTLFGQPRNAKADNTAVISAVGSIDGSEFSQLLARPVASAPKTIEHRNVPKVLELFNGAGRGANHAGSMGTRWGLFNAVTEFVDHAAGRTPDTRLTSAWFGNGHDVKSEAFDLLTRDIVPMAQTA